MYRPSSQLTAPLITLLTTLLVLTAERPAVAEDVDFAKQIQPIFLEHCAGCHGEKKKLGKLRLHTADVLKARAAEDKKLLVAGKPDESDLYKRLVLPADSKKRMPKKADPLPKEKIDLIRAWIEQGAVLAIATKIDAPMPTDGEKKEAAADEEAPAELPLPEVTPADPAAIEKLTASGAQVMNLYADSPLLQVSFAMRSEPASDADSALLSEVAPQVYSLNLAGSKVTEAGLAALAKLENLTRLHLENSEVTDAGLAYLAGLDRLQYVNLYGTSVTDAAIAHLEGLKHLRKLYLWQTKVSYDVAMGLQEKIAGLEVNLGFDHPVVAKKRLTKQLEQAKKQTEEASAEAEKLKQQLETSQKAAEAAKKRQEELEKELKALDGEPAEEAKEAAKPAEEKSSEEKPAAKPEEKPAEKKVEKKEEKPKEEKPAEEKPKGEKKAEK